MAATLPRDQPEDFYDRRHAVSRRACLEDRAAADEANAGNDTPENA
jgi:hypothetical protein